MKYWVTIKFDLYYIISYNLGEFPSFCNYQQRRRKNVTLRLKMIFYQILKYTL